MDTIIEKSVADEIADVRNMRPHLVILGAGASKAAFPNGDASGNKLPVMNDFVDIVAINSVLEANGILWEGRNFEDIYSTLASDPSKKDICEDLQSVIYDYFSSLSLPQCPTLYDHLLLSLRGKDVIATFNWDPFLIQAYQRNLGKVATLPTLLFLHGNVATGYCKKDKIHGTRGGYCIKCKQPYSPTQLLYPIKNKDYQSDPEIKEQWTYLEGILRDALFVTIFGYSAPDSDAAAIEILSHAWGNPKDRPFEQIEIIDINDAKILRNNWSRFIHTHHYDIHKFFYESWIANHPRRTIESYFDQYIAAKFIDNNPIPKTLAFDELYQWVASLNEAEKLQ